MSNDQANILGRYLRAQREAAGLSIRELARLVEVDHGYLIRLEGGQKRNPSAELLHKIANVLELDPTEVLGFIGVEPSSVLPPMEVIFRKKYDLTEAEAKEAADLIEERYGKDKKQPHRREVTHDEHQQGTGDTG